jgi:hypothetical protein
MASSGTYAWDINIAEVTEEAFERCGIDPSSLTGRHLLSARRSLNLLYASWQGEGVLHWKVAAKTNTFTQADESFTLPTGEIDILEAVLRRDGSDTEMIPISRDEFLSIPDKDQQGRPDRYWVERLKTPVVHIWPAAENSTDIIAYNALMQFEDADGVAEDPDTPRRWLEAITSGLASKLAVKFAPDRIQMLVPMAEHEFTKARMEDRSRADISMVIGR